MKFLVPTTAIALILSAFSGAVRAEEWVAFETASHETPLRDSVSHIEYFLGVEGSKQPQDFGGNANFGGRFHVNAGGALWSEHGIGWQLGTAINSTANAVQVFELLGENSGRIQSFTTMGLNKRCENGLVFGFVYDFLYQESYDDFLLGQWRGRASYRLNSTDEVGATIHLSGKSQQGRFNTTSVTLDPISQASVYWRHRWEAGAETTMWFGIAEGHGESNAVTGMAPPKDEVFVFGADLHVPLNDRLALYGETNLMMPADTGTVDAFLGLQFYPWGGARQARANAYAPLLPVGGSTSFSVDLAQN